MKIQNQAGLKNLKLKVNLNHNIYITADSGFFILIIGANPIINDVSDNMDKSLTGKLQRISNSGSEQSLATLGGGGGGGGGGRRGNPEAR